MTSTSTSTVLLLDAMAEPSIELHVQLPTSPESTDLAWIKAASVPISELAQFSTRPYRWMCYVGYCLTGVEGQLSLSMDNRAPVDYDTPDVLEEVESVYYHYPEGYDQEISPIDVQLESSISSSTSSARDPVFRRSIVGRDERDVVTGFEEWSCQAAHLIRFSKGDEYIQRLTNLRPGENGSDIITDINSIRNGLLVNTTVHKLMGKDIAFLPTPNFILDTSHLHVNEAPQETACTLHVFSAKKRSSAALSVHGPHGRRLQLPTSQSSRNDWPPSNLFSYVYGDAILRNFGSAEFGGRLREWTSKFYPPETRLRGRDGGKAKMDRDNAQLKDREERQKAERSARAEKRGSLDVMDTHFLVWSALLPCRSTNESHGLLEKERIQRVEDWVQGRR